MPSSLARTSVSSFGHILVWAGSVTVYNTKHVRYSLVHGCMHRDARNSRSIMKVLVVTSQRYPFTQPSPLPALLRYTEALTPDSAVQSFGANAKFFYIPTSQRLRELRGRCIHHLSFRFPSYFSRIGMIFSNLTGEHCTQHTAAPVATFTRSEDDSRISSPHAVDHTHTHTLPLTRESKHNALRQKVQKTLLPCSSCAFAVCLGTLSAGEEFCCCVNTVFARGRAVRCLYRAVAASSGCLPRGPLRGRSRHVRDTAQATPRSKRYEKQQRDSECQLGPPGRMHSGSRRTGLGCRRRFLPAVTQLVCPVADLLTGKILGAVAVART